MQRENLIICSLLEQLRKDKHQDKTKNVKEGLKQPRQPVSQISPEKLRPPNNEVKKCENQPRLLERRFAAQMRPKVVEDYQPKNKIVLQEEKIESNEAPVVHLPSIQASQEDSSSMELSVLDEETMERSSPQQPPSYTHHDKLDKNFVRMLKEKEMRVKVDAENAEMIDMKMKCKKMKMDFKFDEGQRWREDLQPERGSNSPATCSEEQKQQSKWRNEQGFQKQEDVSHEEDGLDPGMAQYLVFKQLADINIRKAASRAMQEKRNIEAVTAQRKAEEAKERSKERSRLAAVREVNNYNLKVIHEKELRRKANRELELEERRHKMKVFQETDDIQNCLLREHYKDAREIQNRYAKAINDEFALRERERLGHREGRKIVPRPPQEPRPRLPLHQALAERGSYAPPRRPSPDVHVPGPHKGRRHL